MSSRDFSLMTDTPCRHMQPRPSLYFSRAWINKKTWYVRWRGLSIPIRRPADGHLFQIRFHSWVRRYGMEVMRCLWQATHDPLDHPSVVTACHTVYKKVDAIVHDEDGLTNVEVVPGLLVRDAERVIGEVEFQPDNEVGQVEDDEGGGDGHQCDGQLHADAAPHNTQTVIA